MLKDSSKSLREKKKVEKGNMKIDKKLLKVRNINEVF